MATAQNVIDRAIQRSSLNNTDIVSTTQLLQWITQFERWVYVQAATLDAEYFGKDADTATRAAFTDSWDLSSIPGDVVALTRAEAAALVGTVTGVVVGTKINLISIRWPEIDVSPRARVRGRKITSFGTELGADSANMVTRLKLFYSPLPTVVTATTQTLTLPDEWTSLVELPLARLLSIRDRRLDELPGIDDEFKFVLGMFTGAIYAYSQGVRRPISAVPPPTPLVATPASR